MKYIFLFGAFLKSITLDRIDKVFHADTPMRPPAPTPENSRA